MKNILRFLLVPLVILAFAGASFAQATPGTPAAPTKPTAPAKPAEKRGAAEKRMRDSGEVVAADAKAGRLRIKTREKELSLTAETQELKDELAKLKAGDRVKAAYTEKDGKLTLRRVGKMTRGRTMSKTTETKPAEKQTEKKVETKPAK